MDYETKYLHWYSIHISGDFLADSTPKGHAFPRFFSIFLCVVWLIILLLWLIFYSTGNCSHRTLQCASLCLCWWLCMHTQGLNLSGPQGIIVVICLLSPRREVIRICFENKGIPANYNSYHVEIFKLFSLFVCKLNSLFMLWKFIRIKVWNRVLFLHIVFVINY